MKQKDKLVKFWKDKRLFCYKSNKNNSIGLPDYIALKNRMIVIFIESKEKMGQTI